MTIDSTGVKNKLKKNRSILSFWSSFFKNTVIICHICSLDFFNLMYELKGTDFYHNVSMLMSVHQWGDAVLGYSFTIQFTVHKNAIISGLATCLHPQYYRASATIYSWFLFFSLLVITPAPSGHFNSQSNLGEKKQSRDDILSVICFLLKHNHCWHNAQITENKAECMKQYLIVEVEP